VFRVNQTLNTWHYNPDPLTYLEGGSGVSIGRRTLRVLPRDNVVLYLPPPTKTEDGITAPPIPPPPTSSSRLCKGASRIGCIAGVRALSCPRATPLQPSQPRQSSAATRRAAAARVQKPPARTHEVGGMERSAGRNLAIKGFWVVPGSLLQTETHIKRRTRNGKTSLVLPLLLAVSWPGGVTGGAYRVNKLRDFSNKLRQCVAEDTAHHFQTLLACSFDMCSCS